MFHSLEQAFDGIWLDYVVGVYEEQIIGLGTLRGAVASRIDEAIFLAEERPAHPVIALGHRIKEVARGRFRRPVVHGDHAEVFPGLSIQGGQKVRKVGVLVEIGDTNIKGRRLGGSAFWKTRSRCFPMKVDPALIRAGAVVRNEPVRRKR